MAGTLAWWKVWKQMGIAQHMLEQAHECWPVCAQIQAGGSRLMLHTFSQRLVGTRQPQPSHYSLWRAEEHHHTTFWGLLGWKEGINECGSRLSEVRPLSTKATCFPARQWAVVTDTEAATGKQTKAKWKNTFLCPNFLICEVSILGVPSLRIWGVFSGPPWRLGVGNLDYSEDKHSTSPWPAFPHLSFQATVTAHFL